MIKIGIECESIEGKNPMWGVGRLIMGFLKEISRRPELEKDFRFVLYFKDSVPNFPFLNLSIFEKKIIPVPIFRHRLFPVYYFAILPMRLWFERLDWMFWPNYMLPIIAFNRSIVMLTEDVYYEAHAGKLPFRYRIAYEIFGWWTAKFATKILAISKTSKENISKLYGIRLDRIFVSYPGVDLANAGDNIQNTEYVLFVGQAFPRRHLKETILAFEKLIIEYSNILKNMRMSGLKFIAIGPDKHERPIINSLISEVNTRLGREAIIHRDHIKDSDLAELYAGAKILIYVSDREAFGLPPMEALSFGVPPIIVDNELGHELFGEYAFYSKSGSIEDITEAMKEALSNEQKANKIKFDGPEWVKKYNWQSFTERFLKNVKD